jgi:hypothetical protein
LGEIFGATTTTATSVWKAGTFNFYCSFSFDRAVLKPLALQRQSLITEVAAPSFSNFTAPLKALNYASV